MSFRVVVFPYIPPAGASYSDACLRAQPGERVRVVQRAGLWAILEADGRLGLFPIAFTRDEGQGEPVVRTVRQDPAAIGAPLLLEEEEGEIIVIGDDNVGEGALATSGHPCKVGVNEGDSAYCDSSGAASIDSCAGRRSMDDDEEEEDSASLIETARSSPVRCATAGGAEEEIKAEGVVIARSRHRQFSGTESVKQFLSHPQHGWREAAVEDGERQQLQRQYRELHAELTWLSHVTKRIENERQSVIDASHHDDEDDDDDDDDDGGGGGDDREEGQVGRVSEEPLTASAEAEMMKCINHLRSILLVHKVADGLLSSTHPSCGTLQEREVSAKAEEENDTEGYELLEESLKHDPDAASDVRAVKECIRHERETLRGYYEQRSRLLARMERLRRLQAAIDDESRALQESEKALAAVVPPGTYTVVSTSSSSCVGGSNEAAAAAACGGDVEAFNGGMLPSVRCMRSSAFAQERHAAGVEIVMPEGFTWPASLPGLTAEEQDAASVYQQLLHKYEVKLQRLQEEREAAGDAKTSPSIVEQLRQALSAGDKALDELLLRTREVKAFVKDHQRDGGAVQRQL